MRWLFLSYHAALPVAEFAIPTGPRLDFLHNLHGTVGASPAGLEADVVRFTKRRRTVLAEKFGDLANFAVTALVFGQAVGQDVFSLGVGVAGIATWAVFMLITFALSGESR